MYLPFAQNARLGENHRAEQTKVILVLLMTSIRPVLLLQAGKTVRSDLLFSVENI